MSLCRAMPVMIVRSTAAELITGKTPGIPRHTGHTSVLGGAEA